MGSLFISHSMQNLGLDQHLASDTSHTFDISPDDAGRQTSTLSQDVKMEMEPVLYQLHNTVRAAALPPVSVIMDDSTRALLR
ncbi:uncharacterized protein ColSpa_08148 [Colletotrichum spaethianum]|uniref:Uncharacterized protein n=1 Tax=Colletotrichum spaethianum TaxID=700344 RepID=A0AA37P971_9PEZI|nr:uncharacterized protein ColSpa_08148 [Colletotrichum spaethianum]GKT47967.1 hypothetical protein ColSpa_08148 [Colletotrichum spaethianum]